MIGFVFSQILAYIYGLSILFIFDNLSLTYLKYLINLI